MQWLFQHLPGDVQVTNTKIQDCGVKNVGVVIVMDRPSEEPLQILS